MLAEQDGQVESDPWNDFVQTVSIPFDRQYCRETDDKLDRFCIYGNVSWVLNYGNVRVNASADATEPFTYRGTTIIYDLSTTQNILWRTETKLSRLFSDTKTYELMPFTWGFRLKVHFWRDQFAICINPGVFTEPVVFRVLSDFAMVECYKDIINDIVPPLEGYTKMID